MRRSFVTLLVLSLLLPIAGVATGRALAQAEPDWPQYDTDWHFQIIKDANVTPEPFEPWDLQWLHLHRNHPTLPDALVNVIAPRIIAPYDELQPENLNVEVRYVVRDVPVSGWIGAPFRFSLDIDNTGLSQLADGVHGLTIEARGPDRELIQPLPAFVHVSRDLAAGEPFGFERTVPIINAPQLNEAVGPGFDFGPSITYVNPDERNPVGYPADATAAPWTTPPGQTDLYQELMAPHSALFQGVSMWWDHPAHSNAPFVRTMTPKHGEDHRNLRVDFGHERFPMKDGPRGVGWMSPYVSGQVDSQGRFAFAETGGRIGYLMPDGEVITIAGWRVRPDVDPIWWEKPTNVVRQNMENRGNWTEGRGEFFTPLDVAVDPQNENILYVAASEDQVIWRVEVPADPRTQEATISILAGSPGHEAGFVDGQGSAARFDGPASLVFDPVADVLYVADQDNDAIRQVDRSGNVTTVVGEPGMQQRITAAGATWWDQLAARSVSQVEVTPAQAANGVRPDIYLPQTIRVDSQGRIILLELGFGAIRRIDPATGAAETLGDVQQKHTEFQRGWAWLDVDRWGNSGPVDGIYWTKFVSTLEGEIFNEVFEWLPPDGGDSEQFFPNGTGLYPYGWGRSSATNPPHYGWLVAVDPRGGVLLSGGGEHGLTRLRAPRAGDPVEDTQNYWLGRAVFATGAPFDAPVASWSIPAKFGWGGHNYLGFTDAWGLEGASDEELLDAFEVPDRVRNDVDARRQILAFIRPNTVGAVGATTPPPPPLPPPPPPPPPPPLDLRSDTLLLSHSWRQVTFDPPLPNPVVVAPSPGGIGGDPATVQLRNVSSNGFQVRIAEFPYSDGNHWFEEISWIAVSQGRHVLPDGSVLDADIVEPDRTGFYASQSFGSPLNEVPVLLTGVASGGSDRVYVARFGAITTSGYQLEVREQEAISRGADADASVHVIAWEPGSGEVDGQRYEVATTGAAVTHRPYRINFSGFTNPPAVLAQIQSGTGRNPANNRILDITATGALVWVDEEQSSDAEVFHLRENIGYVILAD